MAAACLHGLPGWRLATSGDAAEVSILRAATERVVTMGAERDRRLAVEIVNALAESLSGGRGG